MRIEYYPDTDTLNITLVRTPYEVETGVDTEDPDITLLYDKQNRLSEIEIEHASRRVDIELMQRQYSFEVIEDKKDRQAA